MDVTCNERDPQLYISSNSRTEQVQATCYGQSPINVLVVLHIIGSSQEVSFQKDRRRYWWVIQLVGRKTLWHHDMSRFDMFPRVNRLTIKIPCHSFANFYDSLACHLPYSNADRACCTCQFSVKQLFKSDV
jgi:hypothetical protein